LRLERRAKSFVARGEGDAKGVTDRFEDVAAIGVHCAAHELVMSFERVGHRLRRLFPEMRRTFDVREEQCHRPTWNRHFFSIA